jgi:hypothetical protein
LVDAPQHGEAEWRVMTPGLHRQGLVRIACSSSRRFR